MPCLYLLLDKLLPFIKVIEYAEEADVKGKKSVHCHQDMLQEQHIGYQCVLKYLGKTKFKFDYHMPVKKFYPLHTVLPSHIKTRLIQWEL